MTGYPELVAAMEATGAELDAPGAVDRFLLERGIDRGAFVRFAAENVQSAIAARGGVDVETFLTGIFQQGLMVGVVLAERRGG